MIEGLEREFLDDFTEESKELKGIVRLGTFSTIGRSIVLSVFNEFLRQHSCVQYSYMMTELSELPELFMSSELDFIFLDHPLVKEGIESVYLGDEDYVLIS
jgi:DNA-binding transcriptional LysR family regulator